MSLMFELCQRMLAARKPSFNYATFLRERLAFIQLKAIKEGRPYQVITADQFMATFAREQKNDQNLLCELYLHNEVVSEERNINMTPVVVDTQLRAFISFLANQLNWKNSYISGLQNEQNFLLWIRAEPQKPAAFISQHLKMIGNDEMKDHVMKLRTEVLTDCQQYIKTKASLAVEENKLFWNNCPTERREYHPYNPSNLQVALSRVPRYVESMKFCAEKWIGYRFKFPLLWLPGDQYKGKF